MGSPMPSNKKIRKLLARLALVCHQLDNVTKWDDKPNLFRGLLDEIDPHVKAFLDEVRPLREGRMELINKMRKDRPRRHMDEIRGSICREKEIRERYHARILDEVAAEILGDAG